MITGSDHCYILYVCQNTLKLFFIQGPFCSGLVADCLSSDSDCTFKASHGIGARFGLADSGLGRVVCRVAIGHHLVTDFYTVIVIM